MNTSPIITVYQKISALSSGMVQSALDNDIGSISLLASRCVEEIDFLQGILNVPVSGSLRKSKLELLKKIIADDKIISSFTESWHQDADSCIFGNSLTQH